MRPISLALGIVLCAVAENGSAQAPGKWPPDSLVNVHVLPKNMPVINVVGVMRDFTSALGVRCQYCHIGQEGQPLEQFDFISDKKRTKLTARQMMSMVREINRRVDTLPGRTGPAIEVTCMTCHRGLARPAPLSAVLVEVGTAGGADSAVRLYRSLRERFYGRDAYDFSEPSLNIAAFRLGRASKFAEAFALLKLNEELFPNSSGMYVFRGSIELMRADTNAATTAFREAVRRDSTNAEARGRLRAIGRTP